MKYIAGLVITTAMAPWACGSVNCKEAAAELQAMQKAQVSIKQTLISNHTIFANTLQDYSSTFNVSAEMGQAITKDAVKSISKSAEAFRARGQNAEKLNQKLDLASDEVIRKVVACLNK